jgi:hypothetical protein
VASLSPQKRGGASRTALVGRSGTAMPDHTDQTDASQTTPEGRHDLVHVTIPVPAAHLASYSHAVGVWFQEEGADDSGRGRMSIG